MSAYMVEDVTINKVISYLNLKAASDRYYWPNRMLGKQGYDMSSEDGCKQLGDDMFALNIQGVDSRYPGSAEQFRALDYTYRFTLHTNRITSYKALGCWQYQCSEGDVPQTELYKLMTEVMHALAMEIAEDTPQYKAAKWG